MLKKGILICTIISFFGVLNFSCTNTEENKCPENSAVQVKVNMANMKDVVLTDDTSEVLYIKLETSNSSLFADINKLIINNLGIFILDKYSSRKIFHFTLNGEFIRTIGKPGKGNGEYILPTDFLVREDKRQVEIIDNFNRSNFIYDLEGNFIRKIKYKDYRITSFTKINKSNYLIKLGDNKGMKYEGSHFIIVDGSMKKVIRDFIPVSNEADLINIYPFSNPQNDQNLFSYGFDNNIYEITNNIETPKFLIDFGRNQLKKDDIVKGQKHVISILMASNYAGYIHNLINLDNTIYFNFLYNKETYLFGFEKKTGKSRLINNVIQNKMVGYSNQIVTTYNDFIILRGNSSDIFNAKNELNSTEPKRFGKFTDFQKLQKNTKIDDNPCLVLMKLKI